MPFCRYNAALASLLTRYGFMHHADPVGVYTPRVGMMPECSTGASLDRAAPVHYDNKTHLGYALEQYGAIKGQYIHGALKGLTRGPLTERFRTQPYTSGTCEADVLEWM